MYSNKKQKHINNSKLNSYPLVNVLSRNNNLITIKNYNALKKNNSDLNKLFNTNYNESYLKRNIKPRYNKRIFISSIDNNKINHILKTPNIRIKKHIYLNDSNDNNYKKSINRSNKICQTNNRNKTYYNNLFKSSNKVKNDKDVSLSLIGKVNSII